MFERLAQYSWSQAGSEMPKQVLKRSAQDLACATGGSLTCALAGRSAATPGLPSHNIYLTLRSPTDLFESARVQNIHTTASEAP
jgi:hypothetical protein